MKQSLRLNNTQRLTLTPQLRRSLELLQMSFQQLETAVAEELVENPLLELENEVSHPTPLANEVPTEQQDLRRLEEQRNQEWRERLDTRATSAAYMDDPSLEQTLASHESLNDYLSWQVNLTSLSERDKRIAEHIIHSLTPEGYLEIDEGEIAALLPLSLEVQASEVSAVLSLIQTLDPIGAGAKDLQHRLSLMLRHLPAATEGLDLARSIIDDYFPFLAKRDYVSLSKQLACQNSDLQSAIDLIKQQNPRIANQFRADQQDQIQADIIITQSQQKWVASLNPRTRVMVKINSEYEQLLNQSEALDGREFLESHLQKAKQFIKGIHSRYDTLLAVADVLTEQQQDFFEHGDSHLRPLKMQTIAELLDIHESTVSRSISGKWMQCSQGVYSLKHFFSGSVGEDQDVSATAIQSLIKQMVANEPSSKPLSDSKIAQQLNDKGHSVARRTVAKYRERLQIAPASQRKSLPLENTQY